MVLSTVINLIGIASLLFQGLNLGLDFTGGTVIEVGYKAPVELSEVRSALTDGGLQGPTVQHFGSSRDVMIRLAAERRDRQRHPG